MTTERYTTLVDRSMRLNDQQTLIYLDILITVAKYTYSIIVCNIYFSDRSPSLSGVGHVPL